MMDTKRVFPETRITDDDVFVVMAIDKEPEPGERPAKWVKLTGTWEECDGYIDRNQSPDNPERYELHVKVEG
jgi:hypothetical protein